MVTNKKIPKIGFSLAEVLIATIIMSMMLTAILGYIQYGSQIWTKADSKINNSNYARLTFDLLQYDLYLTNSIYGKVGFTQHLDESGFPHQFSDLSDNTKFLEITANGAGGPANDGLMPYLIYKLQIKNINGTEKDAAFEIYIDDDNCLVKRTTSAFIDGGVLDTDNNVGTNEFNPNRVNTRLARNVKSFEVIMNIEWSLLVTLEFGKDTDDDGILDTSTGKYQMTMVMPQWKNP
jgi:type II secretory pathway pseudopilin PulG